MGEQTSALTELVRSKPWERYGSAVVGIVGHRAYGELRNLQCSIVFEPAPPRDDLEDVRTSIEVGEFLIARLRLPAGVVGNELSALAERTGDNPFFAVDDYELVLFTPDDEGYRWAFERDDRVTAPALGWTASTLRGMGSTTGHFVDARAFEDAGARLPGLGPHFFADWREVGDFVAPSISVAYHSIGPGRVGVFEVHLPRYVRLEPVDVDTRSRRVRIEVAAPNGAKPGDFDVVLRFESDAPSERIPRTGWNGSGDGAWVAEHALPSSAGAFSAELILDGRREMVVRGGVPASSVRVHAELDPAGTWLHRLVGLHGSKRVPHFEAGICNLLGLGGLPIVRYGVDELPSVPDLLSVFTEHGHGEFLILVGECTIEPPGPGKIDKLCARATAVAAQLTDAVPPARMVAAMFTPVELASIPPESVATCRRQHVALVAREGLAALHDHVTSGVASGGSVWAAVGRCVPQ